MTPTEARAIEALVGGAAGAALGGGAGAVSYQPKDPKIWLDEDGRIQDRQLTPVERGQRKDRTTRAALIGALLGAGGGVGGSALRRANITDKEARSVQNLVDLHLTGLRTHQQDLAKELEAVEEAKKRRVFRPGGKLRKRLRAATDLLSHEEQTLKGLAGEAAKNRDAAPFGGILHDYKPGPKGKTDRVPSRGRTHEGMITGHYEKLKETYKTPGFMDPSGVLGEALYKDLLGKTAAEQYRMIWG